MEEHVQGLRTDVGLLKDWRENVVDPHIKNGVVFEGTVRDFMVAFKAAEVEKAKREETQIRLQQTQHQQNSEKQNLTLIVLAILTLVFTLVLVVFGYLALRQPGHVLLVPFYTGSTSNQVQTAQDAQLPSMR